MTLTINPRNLKELRGYTLGRIIYEPKDSLANYVYDEPPVIVWRAEKDGMPYVVKMNTDGRHFRRERWALERLAGLAVPALIDSFTDGAHYLVTEFIPGEHFPIMLDDTFSAASAIAAIGDVAKTIDACHGRGVIHCDLRAPNIMLRKDATPVLIDFEFAGKPYTPISPFCKTDELLEHWPQFSRNSPVTLRSQGMDFHSLATVLDITLGNTFAYPLWLPEHKLTRLLPRVNDPVLQQAFAPLARKIEEFYKCPNAEAVISGIATLESERFDAVRTEFFADMERSRAAKELIAYQKRDWAEVVRKFKARKDRLARR